MPTPQALESLKILAGGPNYRRQRPTEDYGFSGAVPTQGELSSPFEVGQTATADAANARDAAATQKILDTNAAVTQHNRPDVKAIQDEEEADALKRLIMPIQVKGQYDVAAAREHATAAAANTAALIGGRQGVAETNQQNINARNEANAKSVALRTRLQAIQTGKAHAPLTGWSGLVPGAQGRADQAEIQQLMQQLSIDPNAGAGSEAPVDAGALPAAGGGETAAQQLARLRAGRAGR